MKKMSTRILAVTLAAILVLCALGSTPAFAAGEKESIQKFIDGTLALVQNYDRGKDFDVAQPGTEYMPETADDAGKNGSGESALDFEACRLIVKSDKKPDKLNSVGMASGFLNYYIVQFNNELDTQAAYEYYAQQNDILSVGPDEALTVLPYPESGAKANAAVQATVPQSLNSWGAETSGLYDLKQYVTENNLPLSDIVVAVIDSGIDLNHEFFQGRLIETGFNATNEPDPNGEYDNEVGHGTAVTSTITDATSANVMIANYKVIIEKNGLTWGVSSWAVAGVLQAIIDGADILNMSLAFDNIMQPDPIAHEIMYDTLKQAYLSGVTVVASAGNAWWNIEKYEVLPANSPYVITVAACGNYNHPTDWSNYGLNVDITAPGEDLPVAVPEKSLIGNPIGVFYTVASGTSFSAPLTTAACAMIKSLHPDASPDDIKDAVKGSAIPFDKTAVVMKLFGTGMLDAVVASGLPRQKAPIINYASGNYVGAIRVSAVSEGSDEIYYTLDGTIPDKVNGTLYTEPVLIESDGYIFKAMAYKNGMLRSEVVSRMYRAAEIGKDDEFTIDDSGKILTYTGSAYELLIPETIRSITVTDLANGAFDNSSVTGVTLPDTITNLTGGFRENKTVQFVDGEGITNLGDYVFNNSYVFSVNFPNLETMGSDVFRGTYCLSGVNFPNLTSIGHRAFLASYLNYIYLPKLEDCGYEAFRGCTNLYEIYLPSLKGLNELWPPGKLSILLYDTYVLKPLDLPMIEDLGRLSFNMNPSHASPYINRLEFSHLKILSGFPVTEARYAVITMALPATLTECTADMSKIDPRTTYKIYGTAGTFAEQLAEENGFEFIEVLQETAVMTDLPSYYKSYMGELEADVIGFNRTYQWYANTVNSNTGGTPIEGATERKFNPQDYPMASYYYCVVTSTDVGYSPITIHTGVCANRSVMADYSRVEQALAAVPGDLSLYTAESRAYLNNAVEGVVYGLDISRQSEVNGFADAVETALERLVLIIPVLGDTSIRLQCGTTQLIPVACEQTVTWTSSNPDVATVDQNGNVKATGRGSAEITATTAGGQSASCTVTVYLTWWQWLINIIQSILNWVYLF